MVYSDQYKFIFFAVPKTGSRSIQDHLQNYGNRSKTGWNPNHDNHNQVRKTLGSEKLDSYFKFAFFRNPWSLLISIFYYNRHIHNLPLTKIAIIQWLNTYRGDPYVPYIFDSEGNIILDFIGKLENINEDLKIVCEKIGIPTPKKISHIGSQSITGRLPYKQYYDPALVEKIRNTFSKSLSVLKYNF